MPDYEVKEGTRFEMQDEPEPEPQATEPQQSAEAQKPAETVPVAGTGTKKTLYSPEEIENLIKNDLPVEFERLSPEGQAVWKSADRGLKPKLEERGSLKREVEELKTRLSQYETLQQQQAPKREETLDDVYAKDPEGTARYIDSAIDKAESYDEKVRLLNIKSDLAARYQQNMVRNLAAQFYTAQQNNAMQGEAMRIQGEIQKELPEYFSNPQMRQELTEFAITNLGYTDEELYRMTDLRLGQMAVKNLKAVYKLYAQEKAKSAQVPFKQEPPKSEPAGTGFEPPKQESWSLDDYAHARMKNSLL